MAEGMTTRGDGGFPYRRTALPSCLPGYRYMPELVLEGMRDPA